MPEFTHRGRRISYDLHGEGERSLVLIHGVLMNRRMFDLLAPEMAARGNRVITVDLLGHGRSERPPESVNYSITFFAQEILALLDHLDVDEAVVGGTSLGANVALEAAFIAPERVRAMMIEMPVLDNALLACGVIFTPILAMLRFGEPVLDKVAELTSRVPRLRFGVDLVLDFWRQEPAPSAAVLEGLFLGRGAPHHDERVKMTQPTLVIGHRSDPLHPFSDSGMLCEELPNARLVEASSIVEWRRAPGRLNDELSDFLDAVWSAGDERLQARPAEAPVR